MLKDQQPIYSINGDFVLKCEAAIPVTDIGLLRGLACFDFWVTYPHHQHLLIDAQWDRLSNSAALIGLTLPWSHQELTTETNKLLEANGGPNEKAIRVVVTGGTGPDSITPAETPTKIICVDNHQPYPESYYNEGVGVITREYTRYTPGAKSNFYIEAVQQLRIAKSQGAVEVVYFDREQVFEGSTSNIYMVKSGVMYTPKSNILRGITRKIVLEHLDLPVVERDFTMKELLEADEAGLLASNKRVMPIVRIDGNTVGNGKVGNLTQEISRQFIAFTQK